MRNVIGCGLLLVVIAAVILGTAATYMVPRWAVTAKLEKDGFKDVSLSMAWFNRAPIQCAGDDVDYFLYSATVRGQKVTGFACYRGAIWGVAYWND